jgi:hypothetical protein
MKDGRGRFARYNTVQFIFNNSSNNAGPFLNEKVQKPSLIILMHVSVYRSLRSCRFQGELRQRQARVKGH